MSTTQEFTDYGPTSQGTPLKGAYLNALVPVTSGYIVNGGSPSATGGLIMTMPLTTVVIMVSGVPQEAQALSQYLACGPGSVAQDNYIDLDTSGVYHSTFGTVGFTPSAPSSGRLRLFMARTNSTNTAVSLLSLLASESPLLQSNVQYDPTETSSHDVLTHQSTLVNTLHRLTYAYTQAAAIPTLQTSIPVDLTEATTHDTLSGGSSLLNNLDRIRYTQNQVLQSVNSVAQSLAITLLNPHYKTPTLSAITVNEGGGGTTYDLTGNVVALSGGSTDYAGGITWGSGHFQQAPGSGAIDPFPFAILVVHFAFPFFAPTVALTPGGSSDGQYSYTLNTSGSQTTGFTVFYNNRYDTTLRTYSGSLTYTVSGL